MYCEKNLNPLLSEVIRHENNNRSPWAYCEILGDVYRIMIGQGKERRLTRELVVAFREATGSGLPQTQ